jgi:hypothetical protein
MNTAETLIVIACPALRPYGSFGSTIATEAVTLTSLPTPAGPQFCESVCFCFCGARDELHTLVTDTRLASACAPKGIFVVTVIVNVAASWSQLTLICRSFGNTFLTKNKLLKNLAISGFEEGAAIVEITFVKLFKI